VQPTQLACVAPVLPGQPSTSSVTSAYELRNPVTEQLPRTRVRVAEDEWLFLERSTTSWTWSSTPSATGPTTTPSAPTRPSPGTGPTTSMSAWPTLASPTFPSPKSCQLLDAAHSECRLRCGGGAGRGTRPRHHERLARCGASQRYPNVMHRRSRWTGEARWSHIALPPVVRDLVRRPHRGEVVQPDGGPTHYGSPGPLRALSEAGPDQHALHGTATPVIKFDDA
jgi:hypothetical protein